MFVKTSDLPKLDQAQMMLQVQKKFGIGIPRQTLEILRLQKGKTALSAYEYFYYNLFEPHRSWDDKLAYVGEEACRAIYLLANEFTWWNAANDKLSFQAAMVAQGYRTPRLLAVAGRSRGFGGVPNFADAPGAIEWLKTAPMPLFAKPVNESHGVGAIHIAEVDARAATLTTGAGETYALAEFAREIAPYVAADGYIFQEVLQPHPKVSKVTDGRLATVRIIVLLGPDGPSPFHCICRLPAGENRVDNFRRPGNLIGAVDLDTGRLTNISRGVSMSREAITAHPDTGVALADFQLPLIKDAIALAVEASKSFPGLHIQSWDIALCSDGVVAVEMNPGGNLNLVQLSNDRGALTPEFQEFVRWCAGLNLNTHARKRELALKRAA